jgi:UDP-glucose 4-epimerase
MSNTVLVTGGAGYIGSHTVYALLDRGDKVVVLDNLSTGVKAQIGKDAIFVPGDVADSPLVKTIIADHGVDAVIHFAGSIVVPDSVRDPLAYYDNNVVKTHSLLQAVVEAGVRQFFFPPRPRSMPRTHPSRWQKNRPNRRSVPMPAPS